MKKGLKALSAALTMSLVLTSGIFAAEWTDEAVKAFNANLAPKATTETKVTAETIYKEKFASEETKKLVEAYDKAIKGFKKDAESVSEISKVYCAAGLDLESATNELKYFKTLVAEGAKLKTVDTEFKFQKLNDAKTALEDSNVVFRPQTKMLGKDFEEFEKLMKTNKKLEAKGADKLKDEVKATALGLKLGQTGEEELAANLEAAEKLLKKVSEAGYKELVKNIAEDYATKDLAQARGLALQEKANVSAGVITLINDFKTREGIQLLACPFDDKSVVVPEKKANEAKKDAKKDNVPDTAVPAFAFVNVPSVSVQLSPCVKYFGSAEFAEAAVTYPLVCDSAKKTVKVEVPRFTYSQLVEYQVGFCGTCK